MENPKIRFKGFTKDWEQRKLGELVKEGILEAPLDGNHGEKHPTSDEYVDSGIPFLMASDIHNGEVNIYSCKYITKERAERLDKGFARNGDVLLTHKATIGETAILSNLMTEYAMLTPQVTYYRIKNEERLNREYLYSFFNSLDFQTELKTKAAQSTRPYIGITAQQNLKIILPAEIDEQIRIGLYFRNLDHLITLHQRKCEQTKKLKKYMLQKMFPQNGAKVPEIRFDGFTYDWEQRKFGELYSKVSEKNDLSFGADKIISVANMYFKEEVKESSDEYMRTYNVMRLGDIAFEGNKSKNYSHGRFVENTIGDGIVSHVFDVFRPTTSYDLLFWKYLINNEGVMGRIMARCTNASTMMTNLVASDFLKEKILVPSLKEQKKIGAYFDSLDHLITLHQRQTDFYKKISFYYISS